MYVISLPFRLVGSFKIMFVLEVNIYGGNKSQTKKTQLLGRKLKSIIVLRDNNSSKMMERKNVKN